VPDVCPVTVTNTQGKTGTDSIKYVLCRIYLIGANSSMRSRVLLNSSYVLTDISEVDLWHRRNQSELNLKSPDRMIKLGLTV